MSSNFAKSVCGNAGSSSSSCGGASPWPCSSGGVAGEFSFEESGEEVWNGNYGFLWTIQISSFLFIDSYEHLNMTKHWDSGKVRKVDYCFLLI